MSHVFPRQSTYATVFGLLFLTTFNLRFRSHSSVGLALLPFHAPANRLIELCCQTHAPDSEPLEFVVDTLNDVYSLLHHIANGLLKGGERVAGRQDP